MRGSEEDPASAVVFGFNFANGSDLRFTERIIDTQTFKVFLALPI